VSEAYALEAQARTIFGKQVKALRRQNMIPAVIYGIDSKPTHIMCGRRPLEIVLQKAGGSHIINVTVDGVTHNTLIREVQRDKIKRIVMHVDFLQVDLTKKLRTVVPLALVHMPKLSAELMLAHNVMTVDVECLPTNIPDHIEVDVSGLTTLGAKITVADLPQLPNVDILTHGEDIIARVETLSAVVEEEEVVETAAAIEPEVIEKGKKEEEDF
jgi:large subunit ribosomal protein L25